MAQDENGFADYPISEYQEDMSRERAEEIRNNPRLEFKVDLKHTNLPYMKDVAWKGVTKFNVGPTIFRKSGRVVELVKDEEEGMILSPVTENRMTNIVAEATFWYRIDRSFEAIEKIPPDSVVGAMLADPYPPVPRIKRIVAAPIFGSGGELITTPGYNPVTHNYFAKDPNLEIPKVSDSPSRTELAEAAGIIGDDLLGEFRFVGDADLAHAISLLLNPFVRDIIPDMTPMYVIQAPTRGSGKTRLAEVSMIPALGRTPMVVPPTLVEEEMRKRLMAISLASPDAVNIDNVRGYISGESLAAALTSGELTDRILGESRTVTMRFRNTWIATVNNPTVNDDFSRRIVQIRLDTKSSNPENIVYDNEDNLAWAFKHRGRLIWAALTIVKYWVAQGMPMGKYTFNSFNHWAHVHGGILDTMGVSGFLSNRNDTTILADESGPMRQFLTAWYTSTKLSRKGVKASELAPLAETIDMFPWQGKAQDNRTRMGYTLKRFRDQVFGDLRIRIDTTSNVNSNTFCVEKIIEDPPF